MTQNRSTCGQSGVETGQKKCKWVKVGGNMVSKLFKASNGPKSDQNGSKWCQHGLKRRKLGQIPSKWGPRAPKVLQIGSKGLQIAQNGSPRVSSGIAPQARKKNNFFSPKGKFIHFWCISLRKWPFSAGKIDFSYNFCRFLAIFTFLVHFHWLPKKPTAQVI